jgi:hypothetical protein
VITCGGAPTVCVTASGGRPDPGNVGTCWGKAYKSPLCVANKTAVGAGAAAPALPQEDVRIRVHLAGGARLYAINLVAC